MVGWRPVSRSGVSGIAGDKGHGQEVRPRFKVKREMSEGTVGSHVEARPVIRVMGSGESETRARARTHGGVEGCSGQRDKGQGHGGVEGYGQSHGHILR